MNIFSIMGIYGELRPLLEEYDLCFDKGITLLMEDEFDALKVEKTLKKLGAFNCEKLGKGKSIISPAANNCTCVHMYGHTDYLHDIEDYLSTKEYFPIIVTYSEIPDLLRKTSYIILISHEEVKAVNDIAILKEISGIVEFVAEHIDHVQMQLTVFRKSDLVHEEKHTCHWLYMGMLAIAQIYKAYILLNHDEKTVDSTIKQLCKIIIQKANYAEEATEPVDALEAIIGSMRKYVESHEITIDSINKVEGRLIELVEQDNAILYDEMYYYIPQPLFKQMCQPLLQMLFFTEIKYCLAEAGVLVCNRVNSKNYTVKRVLYTSTSEAKRKRFIKLKKAAFQKEGLLDFEELNGGDAECMLEK